MREEPEHRCPTCNRPVRPARNERGTLVYPPHDDLRKVGLAISPPLMLCESSNTPVFHEAHH